jgi:hypothetical protein
MNNCGVVIGSDPSVSKIEGDGESATGQVQATRKIKVDFSCACNNNVQEYSVATRAMCFFVCLTDDDGLRRTRE